MSKRELKAYVSSLKKRELEEQIIDLYSRFKNVKEYYDFAFNPKEEEKLAKAKFDISKEYFPVGKRKAKMRRSVAQKHIRHYQQLGVDPWVIAEIMLFNIEIAQTFSAEKNVKQESFYLSMLKSFDEAVTYIHTNGHKNEFAKRLQAIAEEAWKQNWFNKTAFERILLNQSDE